MIAPQNIVCVSNTTWEGFYTKSTVQILSLLAKRHTILFVEYPFTIKDLLFSLIGKSRAPVERMVGLRHRLVTKKTDCGSVVYNLVLPPVLPVEFIKIEPIYRVLSRFNAFVYARSVRHAMRRLHMDRPVCINAYNAIYGNKLIGKLNEKLHIFYCYDGPDTLRYGNRAVEADQGFAGKVDGVIVTSDFLANSLKSFNPEVHVVKNGVDFRMFSQHTKKGWERPVRRKKVGYVGSLDHRFDIDTVEYAIQRLPDCDFEFVGDQMNKEVSVRLSVYPNVQFKPPVKPCEVPALLCRCDVGIIPYLCTEFTKNIYPLKINEYLSVGVPVVLTAFASLPEFAEIVTFTNGKDSFCSALEHEIDSDNMEKIHKRIVFAANNSWEARAADFEAIVERLLTHRS